MVVERSEGQTTQDDDKNMTSKKHNIVFEQHAIGYRKAVKRSDSCMTQRWWLEDRVAKYH